MDFQMTQRLGLSKKETQEQYMSHKSINNFGLMMIQKKEQLILKKYHHFMSSETRHDGTYTMCCLDYLLKDAQKREIKKLYVWSDNGKVIYF